MTNEEMTVLVKTGITELIPALWERVERFARAKARDYFHLHPLTCAAAGVTLDDLTQEAYFGFLDAVRYFIPEKEYSFLTYMVYPLQSSFDRACCRRTIKGKQSPLNNAWSLTAPTGEDDLTLADTLEDVTAAEEFRSVEAALYHTQLHNTLEECIATLDPEQEELIRARYYAGVSIGEFAGKHGIEVHRCKWAEKKALHCLGKGENRRRLKPFQEDIITTHAYKSSFGLWRDRGTSSTEYTVLKMEQAAGRWI